MQKKHVFNKNNTKQKFLSIQEQESIMNHILRVASLPLYHINEHPRDVILSLNLKLTGDFYNNEGHCSVSCCLLRFYMFSVLTKGSHDKFFFLFYLHVLSFKISRIYFFLTSFWSTKIFWHSIYFKKNLSHYVR